MAPDIKRLLPLVVEALKVVIKNSGRVDLSPLFQTYGLRKTRTDMQGPNS